PESFSTQQRALVLIDELQRSILIKGCRGAVAYGTAAEANFKALPFFVFGKTGTAAASNEFRRYGWVVGFAGDSKASGVESATPETLKLGVLVFLKRGHGWEAAKVARKLFDSFADRLTRVSYNSSSNDTSIESPSYERSDQQLVRVRLLREGRTIALPLEDY